VYGTVVSALLSEMDGALDRGHVVVIGSTNRLDFIDPAFRRPGRLGIELEVSLPKTEGRKEILKIHTSKWNEPANEAVLDMVASQTRGFSGADLKQLTRESAQNALRRTYPQVYASKQKYLLDMEKVKVANFSGNFDL